MDVASGEKGEVRYARVPTGAETCPFCIMLASRGFVYHSEAAARHAHPGCNCVVVPCFDSYYAGTSRRFSASAAIEGYDLDGLYRKYVELLGAGKLNVTSVSRYSSHVLAWSSDQFKSYMDFARFVESATDIEDLQLRCAIIEQEWTGTGLSDKYYSQLRQIVLNKRSEMMGDAYYAKPRSELLEHEKKGVDWLVKNGIRPTARFVDPRGKANIDLEIDGNLWELKNVHDGKHAIEDRMRDAAKKWRKLGLQDPVRIVITSDGRTRSAESAIDDIKRHMKYADEVLFIDQFGNMTRMQK